MPQAFRNYEKRACGPNMAQHYLIFAEEERAKDGPIAKIAFLRSKSGTVTAWVLWIGGDKRVVYEAKAGGHGYDKRTAAIDRIGRQFKAPTVAVLLDGLAAPAEGLSHVRRCDFSAALSEAETVGDWERALEKRGFLVFAAN